MRFLRIMAPVAAAALICAGCSPGETEVSSQEVSVIKIIKPNYISEFTNSVRAFCEANADVQVSFVDAPTTTGGRHDLYVSALSGGDETADIYLINDEWTEEFAQNGYIMPLENEISVDSGRYITDAETMLSYSNELYALPIGIDTDFVFCRNDLLDDTPSDWTEAVEKARSFGADTAMRFCIETGDAKDMLYNIEQITHASGKTYTEALNFYREVTDAYSNDEETPMDCLSTFKTGGALMLLGKGSYWHKLNSSTSAVRSNIGMMLMDSAENPGKANYISAYGLAVNANSKNKEAAIRFLDFMNSAEQQKQLSRDTSIMPVIEELYDDEMVLDASPYIRGMKDSVKDAPSYKSIGAEGETFKELKNALDKFFGKEETSNNTGKQLNALLK